MKCSQCQHESPQGARFCEECATPLARTCPNCRTALSVTAKFCHACAHPVPAGAGTPSPSPETYTPKHLAERILISKAALEGERKQVTVLFADLKGSMELLADRDPEEARTILDPVLEHMMEAVHRYEGTVNQVMGDGIMSLFGAPLAHEDHAVRACYAALRMQDAVKRYCEEIRRSHGIEVQIRVGLNSGEVVVRSIGSDLRMDYTAVGQTTHLAARMEQLATPGTIRLTAGTLRLAEGYVEVKSLGRVPVKGLSAPVEVYEATGAGVVRSRMQAAGVRGLTRFVGRDAEVEQLHKALEQAGDGHGQLVATVGDPGVGKSRLFHEFTHSHRLRGWLILRSSSVSYGKATAYLPIIDLLKGYFTVHNREGHREIQEKVTGKLLTLDRALELSLPALLALLDVPVEDAQWHTLDPAQRRHRTLDVVKRLLLRESQVQPLLVIFEDLHWVDAETQAVLESLVDSLPSARLLLLVNYRPEYQHGWGGKTYYTQLRLDALPRESATELLQALLGADLSVESLKPLLVARTGGNPLFLEESVRTLVETGCLTGELGARRLVRPLDTIEVPATVQAILAARIDRLAAESKQLLQTASVIGKDVPLALLLAIAGHTEDDVRRGLSRLQAAEFIYETSLFPEAEYTFKHALTHEVAYGSLLHERRRAIHARVVDALEALHGDRVQEQVETLAHHAYRGERWDQAIGYLQRAARKAAARSASQEARVHLEHVLEILPRLASFRDARALAIDCRLDIQEALQPLGELHQMLTYLREAEAAAEALNDEIRLGRVSSHMAYCLWWLGEPDKAIESGRRALMISSASPDVTLRVTATLRLGMAYFFSGALKEAHDLFRQCAETLRDECAGARFGLPFLPAVFTRVYQSWSWTSIGEFGAARANAEEAVRIAEAVDHPFTTVWAHVGVGQTDLDQGRLSGAISALELSRRLWEQGGWAFMFPWVAGPLGRAYAAAGRVPEAVALLEKSADQCASMKVVPLLTLSLTHLSEAYLFAGRQHDARDTVQRALQICRVHRQRLFEPDALRIEGEIRACNSTEEARGAEASYTNALALASELGMRPLVAHCHLGLSTVYRRTNRRAQAQEHLTTATTLYRDMGMTYWLEKAEAEMRESG